MRPLHLGKTFYRFMTDNISMTPGLDYLLLIGTQ